MKRIIMVNHLRSDIISLYFIGHIIEVTFAIFLSIFLLGPAVFFIINGLFCGFMFARPYWYQLLVPYKYLFHLFDDDFYMDEVKLGFWFCLSRALMVIFSLGQVVVGIYFLASYGFLNQNLIYLIRNQ
jgi:hypothetical protein